MHGNLLEIIVFLASAVVVVPVFRFFKIGAILAYLVAGIIIGPHALALIRDPQTILSFSEWGVVFLLFLIGLELEPRRLWTLRYKVFGLGLIQMLATGGLLMALGIAAGLSRETAFVAGFGLAMSSTAFSLQILEEHRQVKTLHGEGAFAILLLQDLAVVPILAMIPILEGQARSSMDLIGLSKMLGALGAFVLVGLVATRYIFRFIATYRVQEVFTALSLLIVIGAAFLMQEVGLSLGTGAFLAGVLLANSEYRHELESNLNPFKGLLLGLFFIAVGMSLDLGVVRAKPFWILGLVALFMPVKCGIVFALGRLFRFPKESARNMAFLLPQGGEFAFVLFAAALGARLIESETGAMLNAAVTVSMGLTPAFFKINQRFLRTYSELSERPYDQITGEGAQVIVAGFGRFGQIVSRFLRVQGIPYTILEHSAAQVDTARKFGAKIFYGDASRADIVESAGGRHAKIFVLAIDDPESSVATAKMVIEHFPNLRIIARVRNRSHALDLLGLGIEAIHRETYLTSLEVAKEVLVSLGGEANQIARKIALFRQHDEAILREQLKHRDDEKALISFTNRSYAELEQILTADTDQSL